MNKRAVIKPVRKEKINPRRILDKRRALADEIEEEMEDKGVAFFRPDEILHIDNDYLSLPKDITNVSSRDLGRFLNAFTQHRMYIRTLIGWQAMYEEEAKRVYYSVSTPIYNTLDRKDFPSEKGRERYLNNHPEVKEVFFEYKNQMRKSEIFELNLLSIDDAVFLVSREISRRSGDYEREVRNENVQRS